MTQFQQWERCSEGSVAAISSSLVVESMLEHRHREKCKWFVLRSRQLEANPCSLTLCLYVNMRHSAWERTKDMQKITFFVLLDESYNNYSLHLTAAMKIWYWKCTLINYLQYPLGSLVPKFPSSLNVAREKRGRGAWYSKLATKCHHDCRVAKPSITNLLVVFGV